MEPLEDRLPSSRLSELAAQPLSRRGLIALGAGSAAAAALLTACGDETTAAGDTAEFGEGDVGILNFLLNLEYVEAALYAEIAGGSLLGGQQLKTMEKFAEEEDEHAEALIKVVEHLDGDPGSEPSTSFKLKDAEEALASAAELENLVAAAYLGQVPLVESAFAAKTILSIHSVEGRHATTFETMRGGPITPDGPFAKPMTAKAVSRSLEPFLAG